MGGAFCAPRTAIDSNPKSITRSPGKFAFRQCSSSSSPAPPPPPFSPSFFGKIHFTVEHFITKSGVSHRKSFPNHPRPGHPASAEIRLSSTSLHLNLPSEIRPQSYRLEILPTGISITAAAPPGLFYALQTLLQIIRVTAFQSRDVGAVHAKSNIKTQKFAPLPRHPGPPRLPPPRLLPRHRPRQGPHRRYTTRCS